MFQLVREWISFVFLNFLLGDMLGNHNLSETLLEPCLQVDVVVETVQELHNYIDTNDDDGSGLKPRK